MVQDTKPILPRLIHFWHPYVSYLVMPLFAFANAGISISGVNVSQWVQSPVSLGILLGLCLGKPIGILSFSYLACFFRISQKPVNVTWTQVLSIGFLAGIGFTMSLFILNLGLEKGDEFYLFAKISIFSASLISALLGLVFLALSKPIPLSERKQALK